MGGEAGTGKACGEGLSRRSNREDPSFPRKNHILQNEPRARIGRATGLLRESCIFLRHK